MIYHGRQAVEALEAHLKRPLTPAERRVVMLEGYADTLYQDTKGIWTLGVGQTGEWIEKGFEASFNHHEVRCLNRFPSLFHRLPEYLQIELIQAEYRGDLGHSPSTCKLINSRRYGLAAEEFLDNAEYKTAPAQIRKRMEALAHALSLFECTKEA